MERDLKFLSTTPLRKMLFNNKSAADNWRNPPSCLFLAFLTPFSVIAFINDEATGCNQWRSHEFQDEAAIGPITGGRNPPSCFFILCFTVSHAPSFNRSDFFSDSMLLMISTISSFETNKVNPLPALFTPCPVFFLQIYLV